MGEDYISKYYLNAIYFCSWKTRKTNYCHVEPFFRTKRDTIPKLDADFFLFVKLLIFTFSVSCMIFNPAFVGF